MRKFLLSGFLCFVGLNSISVGILLFGEGLIFGEVIMWLGIFLSIITIISTIYYWFDWQE